MAPIAVYPTSQSIPEPANVKGLVNPTAAAPQTSLFHHAQPRPLATSAQGLYFTLEDGRTVLDGMSGGAAVACLGQGNAEVLGAMMEQASKMAYTYHQSVGCEAGEKLAAMICAKGDFEAAAFLNSGSEAVEACIKMVRQYWVEKGELQRKYIIARFPSYHGNTIGALAVGNTPGRRNLYSPLFSDAVQHVDTPLYKRHSIANETEEQYSARLAFELEAKILELGPENCMAFFAEPVQGSAVGVMPPPRGYFPAIDAVLKKYDLLFVMDEVMSGAGRCGEFYAHQAVAEGVKPDIVSMAKGLGAGYVPISAVVVNKKVADVVRSGGQWKNSHTYQNHPIVCAVGVKILEIIDREDLLSNVRARGDQLEVELREAFKDVPEVFDIRGKGLFWGIELEAPRHLSPRLAERVKNKAMDNGLVMLAVSGTTDGVNGETAMLAPAYTVSPEQISEIVRLLKKSVVECVAEIEA